MMYRKALFFLTLCKVSAYWNGERFTGQTHSLCSKLSWILAQERRVVAMAIPLAMGPLAAGPIRSH
jgi:hypothetical protein